MTARNLKIRITVGHEEGRQPRRVDTPPKTMSRVAPSGPAKTAAKISTTKRSKWIAPALLAGAVFGGLWLVLPDSKESKTMPVAHDENKTLSTPDHGVPLASEQRETSGRAAETPSPTDTTMSQPDPRNATDAVGTPELPVEMMATATAPTADALARLSETEPVDASATGAIGAPAREASANLPSSTSAPVRDTRESVPTSDKVARATFARAISRFEPVESIAGILSADRGLSRLYFFTELQGLRGQRIQHRWIINGQRIAEIPVNVSSDRFRASSNMRLSKNRVGTWEVQVVDPHGNILHASRLEYR